jgi:hypothetical protein
MFDWTEIVKPGQQINLQFSFGRHVLPKTKLKFSLKN